MKYITFGLAIILLSVSVNCAQKLADHGLVITGSVQGVEAVCLKGKAVMQVRVYMQFRNDSDSRLLLIKPTFFFTKKINFVADKLGGTADRIVAADVVTYNPYLTDPFGTATSDDYDYFPSFIAQLDKPEPPLNDLIVGIEPGGYHEFQEKVWSNTGFKVSAESNLQKECSETIENSKVRLSPENMVKVIPDRKVKLIPEHRLSIWSITIH